MVNNTIGQVIKSGIKILSNNNIENPLLEAQLLLANLLNVDKLYIMTNYDKDLSNKIVQQFLANVSKRRNGMPIQYIIGVQEFMSLKFNVNESVLIPRSDTEILVEEVIKDTLESKQYNILEIGTGSGCISVSLGKYIQNSSIYTVDISKEALNVAKENAKLNNVSHKIEFFNGNLFEPVKKVKNFFDFIVSNPPYIPQSVIESLEVNVKEYEPRLALDGGIDGLEFYRNICSKAGEYLKENGKIFFEIGYDQANDVKKLLKNNNFDDIYIVKDLAGNDRVVKARIENK